METGFTKQFSTRSVLFRCCEAVINRLARSIPWCQLRWLLLSLILGACSREYLAPLADRTESPGWRPSQYQIRPGDTLYSIAWEFGFDYRTLARWNNIGPPYKILSGSWLRLTGSVPSTRTKRQSPASSAQPATGKTSTRQITSTKQSTTTLRPVVWRWPTSGKIVETFSPRLGENRGLNIGGKAGQPIKAAGAGVVVYAGEGLKTYGKMVIIKHTDEFLSAYAHNQKMLVKEGTRVSAGQKIATMGRDSSGTALLHFEVRRNGKPTDPLKHLPPRS